MKKEKLILVGGGGHCKSVIDVVEEGGKFEIIGILDVKEKLGEKVAGYNIIGTDDDLQLLSKECKHFIITLGQIKSFKLRKKLYNKLKDLNLFLPVIISPTAYVSKNAKIGEGVVVMHNAFINSGAAIGVNGIINTAALIEHDTQIGDDCHISTGAVINGNCEIGNGCFIGSNAVISNGVKLGSNCIIGAGAVVLRHTPAYSINAGNPARRLN